MIYAHKNVFIRVSMHIFADYNRICDRWTIICDRWKLLLFVETLVFVQVRIKFKVHSNNHRVYVCTYILLGELNFFLLPVFFVNFSNLDNLNRFYIRLSITSPKRSCGPPVSIHRVCWTLCSFIVINKYLHMYGSLYVVYASTYIYL